MRLLIIGGTVFLGRHLVEAALAAGHDVTLFNRGQHNPDLFPTVARIHGDRATDLNRLENRHWDAAIDTCGYFPRIVKASAEFLADRVAHYTFVSSISVYADPQPGMTESGAVGTVADPTVEEITGETYGPLKALCEQAAEAAMPGRTLVVRPGLIVGPHDPSDRFTYWPGRVARGGEVLAPGDPAALRQFIDVRDLAAWMLRMAQARVTGVCNATGPAYRLTMAEVLAECGRVCGSDVRFTWLPDAFLLEQKVGPWIEMPLWIPAESAGMLAVSAAKALANGLRFRPLAETIRDTLNWDRERPADLERRAGLRADKEAELLAAWHRRGA